MKELLKKMIFMTVEDQVTLKDFESWLYGQEELSDNMSDDLIFEAYTFNYNQDGARNLFKDRMLIYFDVDQFMLWKIKANLRDLIDGKNDRLRILYDFLNLGRSEFILVYSIGCYVYYFDEMEENQWSIEQEASLVEDLKSESNKLLLEIEEREKCYPDFRISVWK